MKSFAALSLAVIAMTASAPARGHGHGHHHEAYSAGEPGDPDKPARTVDITMKEMMYDPSRIEVKRGEQIRFVLHNLGSEDHEFLLATTAENLKHAEVMKKHPHMQHDEPNGVRVSPKKTAEILMTGHITVR